MIKKYVVTGGEGFIGSYICRALQLQGNEVHSIDYRPKIDERIEGVHYHDVDIRDAERVKTIVTDTDVVFHIAGLPRATDSLEDPAGTLSVNVLGMRTVLEAAVAAKVRRVVFASSSAIYGEQEIMPLSEDMFPLPLSPYGFQKYLGEMMLKEYVEKGLLESVALRFFNVYGYWSDLTSTGSLAITRFLTYRSTGKPLTVYGDGNQTRDFVHVEDVAKACINAAHNQAVGSAEIINIASGERTSVLKIAQSIGGDIVHVDGPAGEIKDSYANISKAHDLLDWSPSVSFQDGINKLKSDWNIL